MKRTLALVVFASLACTGAADAHALAVDCRVIGEMVEIEAYYDDDTPCRQAKVVVEAANRRPSASGQTDGEGRWSFPRPSPGRYTIVVNDGAGHVARRSLTISETTSAAEIDAGPGREEFTRVPWLKLAFGLGIIAAAAVGTSAAMRLRRRDRD